MYLIFKRIFDFSLAVFLLLLLSPLLVIIAMLLLMTGEHEIFYFQKRIGLNNRDFEIWKFATMLKNSASMKNGSITVRNDPRVTNVGRFLRISKLNELPQIINVLIGNMSFVGPRPLPTSDFNDYSKDVQDKIYSLKPGITGLGSIIFRDEEKYFSIKGLTPREISLKYIAPYKGELEMWYLKNCSFITDFKILIATAIIILFPSWDFKKRMFKTIPQNFIDIDSIV